MRLRNVTTAFLMNGNDMLLSKRSQARKIAPGYWYGVGGHLEPDELNDPQAACLREIREETGLDASHVLDLQLRYIVMRRSGGETVINYFFFGRTSTRKVVQAAGEDLLQWIPRHEALDRPLFPAIGLTLAHFLEESESAGTSGDAGGSMTGSASGEGASGEGASGERASGAEHLQIGLATLANGEPAIQWLDVMDWADQA